MGTESNEMLAVGMFGSRSRIRQRIELLLHAGRTFSGQSSRVGTLASAAGLCVLMLAGSLAPRWIALAQPSVPVPPWQIAAGGKMAFLVASVKPTDMFRPPNFALDVGDAYRAAFTNEPPRGRFSAVFKLETYITFAYKLSLTADQRQVMLAGLPKWVSTDLFAIEARAPRSDVTKDQMRLMMQSLLAERFNLAVHMENQIVPGFALVLSKPGKLGPKLRPHSEGPPCDLAPPRDANLYPAVCDIYEMMTQPNRMSRAGSRNTTMELLAGAIPTFGSITRPVVDHTGLSGRFDFTWEWVPDTNRTLSPAGVAPPELEGPEFLQALNEQLGLKLEPAKVPSQILVIDHVERPAAN